MMTLVCNCRLLNTCYVESAPADRPYIGIGIIIEFCSLIFDHCRLFAKQCKNVGVRWPMLPNNDVYCLQLGTEIAINIVPRPH